jgi:hypothetical protein
MFHVEQILARFAFSAQASVGFLAFVLSCGAELDREMVLLGVVPRGTKWRLMCKTGRRKLIKSFECHERMFHVEQIEVDPNTDHWK